jgi:hypothetical protein
MRLTPPISPMGKKELVMNLYSTLCKGQFADETLLGWWLEKRGISKRVFWAKDLMDDTACLFKKYGFAIAFACLLLGLGLSVSFPSIGDRVLGAGFTSLVFTFVGLLAPRWGTTRLFRKEVEELRQALGLKEEDKLDVSSLGNQVGRVLVDLWFNVLLAEQDVRNRQRLSIDAVTDKCLERRRLVAEFDRLCEMSNRFGVVLGDRINYYQEAERKLSAVSRK